MSFRTLATTYVLGGLTFLPLLFALVVAAAWYLLPKTSDSESRSDASGNGSKKRLRVDGNDEKAREAKTRQDSFGETAASGTFAVLRKYDFQAATTALNAKNNPGTNGSGTSGADGGGGPDSSSEVGNESVYQSMYRSVFVGNRNTSTSSLLDTDDGQQSTGTRRRPVPANVLYIVLRHGHLMVYDSPTHVDVKQVISLAHHRVSLQAGSDGEDADETRILEADLYTKRTAIVLTPVELPNGVLQQPSAQTSAKPFYLFCATNIEKEDFYRALLLTRSKPPVPRPLDTDALIKLQSTLHSSSLTPETRALNAMIGRVFLGIHQTNTLVDLVRSKIERKLGRIQKPSFIPVMQIRSLELGDAAPVFSNLKLRDFNIAGDMTISADMRYNGGLSITLLAVAKLDLGPRFKTRTVDLVLKTSLHRIQGTMLLHIKQAPSNRMWFCFETMPELEVRVQPVVSERKITYGFVLRAIEERVRTAFAEGLVKPNWDDVPMPLQDTRGSHARGGLWMDEKEEGPMQSRADALRILSDRNEKAVSMPSLQHDNTASTTGTSSSADVNLAKIRHAATMPVDGGDMKRRPVTMGYSSSEQALHAERPAIPPKPMRTPSITSISPSVAIDGQSVEPVRSDDASLRPTPPRTLWRSRGASTPQQQHKDAIGELRDLQARTDQAAGKPADESDAPPRRPSTGGTDGVDTQSVRSRQFSDDSQSTIPPATPRSFSARSSDSDGSSAPTSLSSTKSQQRKANIISAAGAATNAARNWGWNTYQKNKGTFQRTGTKQEQTPDLSEPMGRGQPLPPPGTPLPGPNKSVFGGIPSMRRKPAPVPPQRSTQGEGTHLQNSKTNLTAEEEFGTWHENSGSAEMEDDHSNNSAGSSRLELVEREASSHTTMTPHLSGEESPIRLNTNEEGSSEAHKAAESMSARRPPPLPKRRRHTPEDNASQASSMNVSENEADAPAASTPNNGSADEVTERKGLHVPENTARAIAAENSTAELAHGASDDKEHVDESRGVETEIRPDDNLQTMMHDEGSREDKHTDEVAGEGNTLRRTNTEERFARGENVTEEDFEWEDTSDRGRGQISTTSEVETGNRPVSSTRSNVESEMSRRIKAQVQKHAGGED